MYPEISEQERFPMLTRAGRKLLYHMRQHPHAPIWNWPNGEQLNESGLAIVNDFADQLRASRNVAVVRPEWLEAFVTYCCTEVPFYRCSLLREATLTQLRFDVVPTCCRNDLAPRVWDFVPDCASLEDLIVFSTSGTTGHPTRMLSQPANAACGVPLIEFALQRFGVEMPRGSDRVSITNVAAYRGAFTTAIVIAYLKEAGCVRVNLDASAWRRPVDCVQYINELQAPIWLGDPVAYAALEKLDVDHAPKAIVSSIMRLSPGYAERLKQNYGCPILDLYALTEVGILALKTDRGHEVLPHDVYVEIVDTDGRPVPDGTRGEVTVTSGRNPYMPLLRYRTGDFASMERDGSCVFLVGLEGRSPVFFPLPSGRVVHSMEITRLMRTLPVLQYRLHQTIDGEFHFGYRGLFDVNDLRRRLSELLEWPRVLRLEELAPYTTGNQKVVEFHSDAIIAAIP